jgi:hypothetical protein
MEVVPRIVEDLYRRVAPPVWNDLGRPALVGTAYVTEFTGLAAAAAAKATIEYGMLKPLFYAGKVVTRGGIEAYNWQARRRGVAPVAPNAWYYPHLDHFNWGNRTRTRATGNSDRPNWMNWFWNPEAARYWGPWGPRGGSALPGARGAGNFRIADQRLRLRHLPKWGDSGSDRFDPDTMYEPKKAHSARWYQDATNWLSQQIVQEVEQTLEGALTPRLNAAGTHYIQADGTNPIPIGTGHGPGGIPGDNAGAIAAAIAAGDAVPDAADDANAHLYYPDPELWLALNNPDADIKANAIAHVIDEVTTRWKEQHLRINEVVKQQVAYEHLEDLKRNIVYNHALQKWLKLVDNLGTWSYGIDDLVLKLLNGLL